MRKLIELSQNFPVEFLRGLFDAEGSSSKNRVEFSNTNLLLLDTVQEILRKFEINSKRKLIIKKGQKVKIRDKFYRARKNIYTITISRKAHVEKFVKLIGFWDQKKTR